MDWQAALHKERQEEKEHARGGRLVPVNSNTVTVSHLGGGEEFLVRAAGRWLGTVYVNDSLLQTLISRPG